jgi:hypothetical protein
MMRGAWLSARNLLRVFERSQPASQLARFREKDARRVVERPQSASRV